ncbi:MAG: YciI family protein [Opitutaceae bacterium]
MATKPGSSSSPFLLLFRNAGPDVHRHLSADQRAQLTKRWNDWYDGLAAAGKVEHGRPLGLGGRVVAGSRGEQVTDGPYAEAKEVVGGYFFLTVADLDEATEIAKGCPGLPLGLTIEVRPVVEASPVLENVRGRPPAPTSTSTTANHPPSKRA